MKLLNAFICLTMVISPWTQLNDHEFKIEYMIETWRKSTPILESLLRNYAFDNDLTIVICQDCWDLIKVGKADEVHELIQRVCGDCWDRKIEYCRKFPLKEFEKFRDMRRNP